MSRSDDNEPLELTNREELLSRFARQTSELMTVVDLDGRFLYANPAAERTFGEPVERLVGQLAFEFVHPEDRARTKAAFEAWVAANPREAFVYENRQQSHDGTVRRMRWTIAPYYEGSELRYFISSARDITTEHDVAQRLRQGELRLRSMMDGVLDPLITINGRGIIQDASRSVTTLLGYEPGELIGQNIKRIMPEPHRSNHDEYLARYAETGNTWILNTTRQFEVVCKDGNPKWVELSVSRVDIPGEAEPIFCGSFRDVTDRLNSERAREESERRLRAIFDQEYEYVGLLDREGRVIDMNRAALEIAGHTQEEVVGLMFWETRLWGRDVAERERLQDAIRRAGQGEFIRYEAQFPTRNRGTRYVDFSLKPIFDEEGAVVMLIPEGRDITELKLAQQRETAMLRALATIGESAAVLAHEIKNPITAVNLALRAVADQLGEGQAEILEDLASRMKRLETLMRRTLSFAKPLSLQLETCDLCEVVQSWLRLLRLSLHMGPSVCYISFWAFCTFW